MRTSITATYICAAAISFDTTTLTTLPNFFWVAIANLLWRHYSGIVHQNKELENAAKGSMTTTQTAMFHRARSYDNPEFSWKDQCIRIPALPTAKIVWY